MLASIKAQNLVRLSIAISIPLAWMVVREYRTLRGLNAVGSLALPSDRQEVDGADCVYFYSTACSRCRITTPLIARIARDHPELRFAFLNVAAADFYTARQRLNARFSVPRGRAAQIPALFSRRSALVGSEEILGGIENELKGSVAAKPPLAPSSLGSEALTSTNTTLSIWPVALAALVDSFNPCALTTALFLISYLSWAGHGRGRLAALGTLYCLGVFACYGLAGVGLLRGLHALAEFGNAQLAVYFAACAGTLYLAAANLGQYILLRRRAIRPTELGLPQAARGAVHATIRKLLGRPALFGLVAFFVGGIVAAIEVPCTGQVYFPTLVYLAGHAHQGRPAIALLAVYNLIFIAPLVLVFSIAILARSTRSIQRFIGRYLPATRLANAVCFLAMAGFFFARVID